MSRNVLNIEVFQIKFFLKIKSLKKKKKKKKKQLLSHRQKYNQLPYNSLNGYIAPLP